MIEMCIELDQPNEKAREASAQLMAAGEAAKLLDILEQAPQDSSVASQLWSEISNPRALRQLLAARRPDFDALDRIFAQLGPAGAESMLDALSRSKARPVRQYLLEQITGMGSEVGPQIADMVADPRWYVVRNMLVLLSSLTFWPEDFDISPYLAHSEPRVRVAAFRLAAWRQDHRERAICLALQDADERVVAVGLAAASESCPLAAEPILARQLRRREWPTEHRVQALRALGTLESRSALTSVAAACLRPRWIFGRQLSSEAALVQAGVSVLTKRWPESREAKRVLRLTAKQGTRASAGRRQTDIQPRASAGRRQADTQQPTSAGRQRTPMRSGTWSATSRLVRKRLISIPASFP
jgi:thioesterase domain-containing protein